MAVFEDFSLARQKVKDLMTFQAELTKAMPFLYNLDANLAWQEKVCNVIPAMQDTILSSFNSALGDIKDLTPANFTLSAVTAVTGSFVIASGNTRSVVRAAGTEYFPLLEEYDQINKAEQFIDQAASLLQANAGLVTALLEAKSTYKLWQTGNRDNSDLAKDIRSFQDLFKGYLNNLRFRKTGKKAGEFSWPKMAEAIAKDGPGHLKNLKAQQSIHDKLHLEFTLIIKKTKLVDSAKMKRIFTAYVEHLFITVALVQEDLLNP